MERVESVTSRTWQTDGGARVTQMHQSSFGLSYSAMVHTVVGVLDSVLPSVAGRQS